MLWGLLEIKLPESSGGMNKAGIMVYEKKRKELLSDLPCPIFQ